MGAMPGPVVARQAYRAMHAGKTMAIHGLLNKFSVFSVRLTPRAVVRAVAASLNRNTAGIKQLGS